MAVTLLALLVCFIGHASEPQTARAAAPGLKHYLAKLRPDFRIGVYFPEDPSGNPKAAAFVADNFTFATLGAYMKATQPRPGDWDLAGIDAKAKFLVDAKLDLAIHHGVGWNTYNPDWLSAGRFAASQLKDILDERVKILVTRYRDRHWLFHVVNEAFDRDGKWRDGRYNAWMALGWHEGGDGRWPLYIEAAFRSAREHGGAGLQLIYNDNNNAMLSSIKSDRSLELFRSFRRAGVPIDGVGFQLHTAVKDGELHEGSNGEGVRIDLDSLARNIRRFAEAGGAVHITEFDVHLPPKPSARDYQIQADAYRDVLKRCIEAPNCRSFNSWGSSDHNWGTARSGARPPSPHAMMLDEDYRPKPAYEEMLRYLESASGLAPSR